MDRFLNEFEKTFNMIKNLIFIDLKFEKILFHVNKTIPLSH